MDCRPISYERLPKTSALLKDYIYHFERVSKFYENPPFDPSSFKNVAGRIQYPDAMRREMAAILKRQNQAFGCGEATLANIDLLAKPGTVAVVTGQQVGFFSGPAFTLYKALTTVKLVQAYREQGMQVVPAFWLATEDHDLEEVASTTLLNENYEPVKFNNPGIRPAPQSPVGIVRFTDDLAKTLEQLNTVLPAGESRDSLLADLRECYVPGATWGQAFAKFMTRLFGRFGVILLDPLDEAVHALASNVYQNAIEEAPELRKRLMERSATLEAAGYHAQVHVDEESTLLFLTVEGNRLPLHQRDGKFIAEGHKGLSSSDLGKIAMDSPIDLTSNVLLRPLVQDTLLPTAAYVAGPSELAYFGQVQVVYQAFGRPQPVVIPRASFTLIDRRVKRLMEKYELITEDVWAGKQQVSGKIAATGFSGGGAESWADKLERNEREMTELLERLRKDVESLDPTLLDTVKHAEEKVRFQMEKLRGKISRAAMQKSDVLTRHEENILRLVTPQQALQERGVCGVSFLARAGTALLDRLLAEIQTSSSEHIEFVI